MDGWQQSVVEHLPLAEAAMQLFGYVTEEKFLAEVFERYRGRSYEDTLSFSTLVRLVCDALVEHSGSARRAMERAEERDDLEVTKAAVYGKLRRIPQSLSHGFLAAATQRLTGILAETRSPLPKSLRRFAAWAIDGKKIKRAAKRLMATRKFQGSVLGGKALVALCLRTGLAAAMSSHLDGEANDPPLVPELLAQLRELEPKGLRLYVFDRQFCDLKIPALLAEENDYFVIRYHSKVSFTADPSAKLRKGKDRNGRRFHEEWGWMGRAGDKRRCYVRRITLKRPDGEDLIIVTNLLDADKFPASDLLELYRQRWGIERVFQQVTEVFHLQNLIASTPEGTIFQCAFCLLLYNMLQSERSYLAKDQSLDPEKISLENLFYDVHRELIAWDKLLGSTWTVLNFRPRSTIAALSQRLEKLLCNAWKPRWLKAVKNTPSAPQRKTTTSGGHTSIYRLRHQHLRQ